VLDENVFIEILEESQRKGVEYMASIQQENYLVDLAAQHPVEFDKHVKTTKTQDKMKRVKNVQRKVKTLSNAQARTAITNIKRDVKKNTGRNAGSQLGIITDRLLKHELDVKKTTEELMPFCGVWKGLTFSKNSGHGSRIPLPQNVQEKYLAKKIEELAKELKLKQKKDDGKGKKKQQQFSSIYRRWMAWVREARTYAESRNADRDAMDQVGLRAMEHGCAMLAAGVPIEACQDAMTMHWPEKARKDLGVKMFDFQGFRKSDREEDKHAVFPYVMALHEAGIPIFLTGPKGTGKTTIAYQLTEMIFGKGTDRFGVVSMTSGTSPSAFNGRPRIAGKTTEALVMALLADDKLTEALELAQADYGQSDVVQSQWERVYSGGGGFLFDELDAADENLLLLVNTALSNGYFSNTASGDIVYEHEDFIPIAAGNTIGVGAQRGYTGRNRLDDATLDRWNMGRVRVTLDPRIEELMCKTYEIKTGVGK